MNIENWSPIKGYEGYEVSDLGNIRSYRRSHKPRRLTINYVGRDRLRPQAQLYQGKSTADYPYVSQLVAEAFIPDYNGQRIQYIDGNPSNVRADNLYFVDNGWIRTMHGSRPIGRVVDTDF